MIWRSFIVYIFAAVSLFAARTSNFFSDGDKFILMGDSITHGGNCTQNLMLFYATRFPDINIDFINAGISGGTAKELFDRIDKDVVSRNPNVVSLMMGMNDVGRSYYPASPSDGNEKKRERAISSYENYVIKCLDAVSKSRIVLFTPSIYDETIEGCEKKNHVGVNMALGRCGEFIKKIAPEYNAKVVDLWTCMNEVNSALQKDNPKDTIVGKDRVHPGDLGGFVMAYEFIRTLEEPSPVSELELDAASGKVSKAENCKVSDLSFKNGISFSLLEDSLPFPMKKSVVKSSKYVDFLDKFNREILRIKNLPKGEYSFEIDGEKVGEFRAEDFEKGVNVSELASAPQCVQAHKVWNLCAKLREVYSRYRNIKLVEFKIIPDCPNISDKSVAVEWAKKAIEKDSKSSRKMHPHFLNLTKRYISDVYKEGKVRAEVESLKKKIYSEANPKNHVYRIVKK